MGIVFLCKWETCSSPNGNFRNGYPRWCRSEDVLYMFFTSLVTIAIWIIKKTQLRHLGIVDFQWLQKDGTPARLQIESTRIQWNVIRSVSCLTCHPKKKKTLSFWDPEKRRFSGSNLDLCCVRLIFCTDFTKVNHHPSPRCAEYVSFSQANPSNKKMSNVSSVFTALEEKPPGPNSSQNKKKLR